MKRIALIITAAAGILFMAAAPAFASHIQDVLGEQTSADEIHFPPVTAGAGAILPDNPFYFADKMFQQVKLAAALSPEKKAETRNMLIGERLAELRVMTERNNTAAIKGVLDDIGVQSEAMAKELADAGAQGRNVTTIAQNINNSLKVSRDILKDVSEQAHDPLALDLESARQSLLLAKVKVEEELPESQMIASMNDDLEDEVDTQVLGVETASNNLENRLMQLDRLASQAGVLGNKKLMEELKKKREQIRNQIKANNISTKNAIKQLKDNRKDLKKAQKQGPTPTPCVEANFENHGQYVACVSKQKLGGQVVRQAAQDNNGQNNKNQGQNQGQGSQGNGNNNGNGNSGNRGNGNGQGNSSNFPSIQGQ